MPADSPHDTVRRALAALYDAPEIPEIRPGATALLTIDMQRRTADPAFGVGRRAQDLGQFATVAAYYERLRRTVVPNVRALQDAARRAGVEVLHARVAAATADGRDESPRYRRMGIRAAARPDATEILPEVAPSGDEIVFDKSTSSVFLSTTIDLTLRRLGIRDLVLVGVVTNGCVESTARSAAELDYRVAVVEDATAAVVPELHRNALVSMGYKDAAIISSRTVLARLPTRYTV